MNALINGMSTAGSLGYAHSSGKMDGRLERLFNKFDTNGDGVIDQDELSAAKADAEDGSADAKILDSLTTDSNGSISEDDFKNQVKAHFAQMRGQRGSHGARPAPPDPAQMFGQLDVNGDGQLDSSELEQMASRGPGGGPSASQLLSDMDTDGDGAVSESEFKAQMEKMQSQMMASGQGGNAEQGAAAQSTAEADSTTGASAGDQLALLLANALKSYNQNDSQDNQAWTLLTGNGSALSAGGLYV